MMHNQLTIRTAFIKKKGQCSQGSATGVWDLPRLLSDQFQSCCGISGGVSKHTKGPAQSRKEKEHPFIAIMLHNFLDKVEIHKCRKGTR